MLCDDIIFAETPFHFDRVGENTSFNLSSPVVGRSLGFCCKTILHMLYKVNLDFNATRKLGKRKLTPNSAPTQIVST
jgi:hypothetical protein